jgi:hypothetical protein
MANRPTITAEKNTSIESVNALLGRSGWPFFCDLVRLDQTAYGQIQSLVLNEDVRIR